MAARSFPEAGRNALRAGLPWSRLAIFRPDPWPFADGSFDCVVLAFLLHHVSGGDAGCGAVLREAARVAHGRVLVLEDQPGAAGSEAARRLAWRVTEEHFRPFGQDPAEWLAAVRPDEAWRRLFAEAGLEVRRARPVPGTLRHPVPHVAYELARQG
ncbi:unnamed protein product [Prorocentrum cordatum]|uniref:Methyltransferase type 11 domain-containing protein n=1 Tax=Prorocentrum cordatum TaxID=2364126 RepID=A0ABN9TGK0_9DINO|nr:unnamed protein product [Polarella glacialis]